MRPAATEIAGLAAQRPLAQPRTQTTVIRRMTDGFLRHWLLGLNLLLFTYVSVPWLAPVLMETGQVSAARAVYWLYSTQCHQLPQRSFFLFGAQPSYSLSEIQEAGQATNNPFLLRQFVGNPLMGWKVAWSDRMVSMYTSMLAAGLLFSLARRRMQPLPVWAFALLLLPMALDGASHVVSNLAGIGNGFRDRNLWLATLTGGRLSLKFYAGDALGSFNSWMRLITGALFGGGVVGLVYPHLERFAQETRARLNGRS